MPSHHYLLTTVWTGNTGKGTASYRDYERIYEVRIPQKPVLLGSSDPKFRGDPTRHNPEDLLLASLPTTPMQPKARWKLPLTGAVDLRK